jgi:hypothetical protein
MGPITYYVALPFVRTEEGDLVAGEAKELQTANAAVREAQRLAATCAGAIAFSRTGDPSEGVFEDAVVIKSFGDVPDLDALLSGG